MLTLQPKFGLMLILTAALPASLCAQATYNQVVDANTYVSSAQPGVNFGGKGAMEIAVPTAAQQNTEESLIQFSTTAMESAFNTDYGAGNWMVTGVTLTFFSNFATAGQQPGNSSFNVIEPGGFELDWLSDNNWSQSAITWNNISSVLPGTGNNTSASLGDFNWQANGASSTTWTLALDPNLSNAIDTGTAVTIFGQPTANSTVGYLFNTLTEGNAPILNVTAEAVPEPSSLALVFSGLAGLATFRSWKRQG